MYIKNFGPGLKWLVGTVGYVTDPVSYTVVLGDGRECRRHVDHVRARHANTRSVVSTTRSNQVDAETAVQERYEAPISTEHRATEHRAGCSYSDIKCTCCDCVAKYFASTEYN